MGVFFKLHYGTIWEGGPGVWLRLLAATPVFGSVGLGCSLGRRGAKWPPPPGSGETKLGFISPGHGYERREAGDFGGG